MSRLFIPLFIVAVLLIGSCTQAPVEYVHRVDTLYIRDTLRMPDTNALKLKGRLHGKAVLYDYNGYVADNSGITVMMEGTPYSATTNAEGRWTMSDLPTATYTVVFSKEGFGTYKMFGFQFVGGGEVFMPTGCTLPRLPHDYTLSNLRFTGFQDYGSGNVWAHLDVSLTPPRAGLAAWIAVGRDSMVSANPSTRLDWFYTSSLDSLTGSFSQLTGVSMLQLARVGFKSGDSVFVTAYPSVGPGQYLWRYHDPKSEQDVSIGLGNRSNIVRIVMP